jgi:hypothetical protein
MAYDDKLAGVVIVIQWSFVILVMCQGVILGIFRFSEPVYYLLIVKEIKSWYGFLAKEEDKKSREKASMSAFSKMI